MATNVRKLFKRPNTRISIGSAAALLSAFSLASTVLGLVRTSLINSNYFRSFSTDAYFAAFKIPDFVFFALASGALAVAFMPVLTDKLERSGKPAAWKMTSSVLNTLAFASLIFSIVIAVFAPQIVRTFFDFSGTQADLCASIMRVIAINPFLFSISTVLTATQQAVGRFFFFASAPLIYNASIIIAILTLKNNFGIMAPAIGVAIGAILQLVVASLGMVGMKFRYTWGVDTKSADYREVMRALPARSIDQGIDHINGIFETRFASSLSSGAVSSYENALLLHNAPIMLIGIAISSAAFPRFNERLSQGRPDLFRKEFLMVLHAMIWIALPVVVITFFGHEYLARLIAKRENQQIAVILQFLSVAIFFRTLYAVISRWFYAQKDTKTPLLVSLFTIGSNVILAYKLSRPNAYGVVGLALAQSIVATVEVFILLTVMAYRDKKMFNQEFITSLAKTLSTTGFSVVAASVAVAILPLDKNDLGLTITSKLAFVTITTFVVHIAVSSAFKLAEVKPIIDKLKKIVSRPLKIQ